MIEQLTDLLLELTTRAYSASADADNATGKQASYWSGMEDAYRDAIVLLQRAVCICANRSASDGPHPDCPVHGHTRPDAQRGHR